MRITIVTKNYMQKMWKALLLKLAINLVLDVLLAAATKGYNEADKPENKEKWLNVMEFLAKAKSGGLPL